MWSSGGTRPSLDIHWWFRQFKLASENPTKQCFLRSSLSPGEANLRAHTWELQGLLEGRCCSGSVLAYSPYKLKLRSAVARGSPREARSRIDVTHKICNHFTNPNRTFPSYDVFRPLNSRSVLPGVAIFDQNVAKLDPSFSSMNKSGRLKYFGHTIWFKKKLRFCRKNCLRYS